MSQHREPGWETHLFKCLGCEHRWPGWLPTHVTIPVWIATAKSLRCPHCGARANRIVLDLATEREAPP
jgi:DNA-directed RNA polymerase subunit RPC12/RpoP